MNLYIIGIIIFSLVLIVSILLLIYFINDEKNIKEVDNDTLVRFGKVYTKKEIEDRLFKKYTNIFSNIQYENYSFLKDAVSDEIYNQILLKVKENREKNQENIITDIKEKFCHLIGFDQVNELEVAKLWVSYSCIEYIKTNRTYSIDDNNQNDVETIIQGSKENPIDHEYILTFVKDRSQNEDIVCPNCGYQMHILTSSHCERCDLEVVPKKQHWVFVGKVVTNISKNKKG